MDWGTYTTAPTQGALMSTLNKRSIVTCNIVGFELCGCGCTLANLVEVLDFKYVLGVRMFIVYKVYSHMSLGCWLK